MPKRFSRNQSHPSSKRAAPFGAAAAGAAPGAAAAINVGATAQLPAMPAVRAMKSLRFMTGLLPRDPTLRRARAESVRPGVRGQAETGASKPWKV